MVPKGWSSWILSDICRKQISYGIVQTGDNLPNGIPCLRVVDLTRDVMRLEDMIKTSEETNKAYRKTILEKDEIVMALRGEIGLARLIDDNLVGANITRGLARISPETKVVLPEFLLWELRSPQFRADLIRRVGGSALQEISLTELRKVRTLLPPLLEQKKIAQILSTWDKAISVTEKLLVNSQRQKKALMQQLLTGNKRLLDENGVRFSGEWQSLQISDIGTVVTGSTPPKNDSDNYGGDISWATAEDFVGKYVSNTKIKLSEQGAKKARIVPKGSILVTCIASIGKNAIADENMGTNQQINSVIVRGSNSNEFFYYQIEFNVKTLLTLAGTTAVPIINKSSFEKVSLKFPHFEEQQKIADVLSAADAEITTLQKKLACLKEEKKALMQQLLTGKRRVKVEAEEAVSA
ncbi:restriction endonuclease subunit S [Escherichia coli]|jgi:type I restriction enzyme S subunit|uniref:Restriction endonuclease subunit S n=2 Tax=Escherichia coli TaxID=562 RepID=A0A2X7BKD7_ECOLX|nr:restriction endonuclease subunit S [Escherichia coli]EEZ5741591.1 restriction endonuclease subunit S [Escherichia coli O9]EEZ7222481.1 restriction endonuclease subunit S [Escherichia coli O78]EFA8318538.1 restriction endonuclease subunit S [Escherichia coli O157]EFY4553191.1 restriction endonuclease subunit S [Shigella boydii]EGX23622.1 type I restriction modification DNA specificity domain protein [Escherichia coli TX1999]